jgi:hypothetical protein
VAALADAARQPRYAERTVFRALMATAGWTGATTIRPARAELVPEPTDQKWPAPACQTFYLPRIHMPMPGKHTLHRDMAVRIARVVPWQPSRARRIRHSK